VGALPAPDAATLVKLAENTPAQNLDFMRNAASAGKW
jgi:hypothetical protein